MKSNKTIVITGGAQGIGYCTALSFLAKGYNTAIWDFDQEALEELRTKHHDPKLLLIQTDVSSEEDVKRAVIKTMAQFKSIDILVNNAAISCNKPIESLSLSEWEKVIAVNLTGTFLCSKHCAAELTKVRGRIINIASTRALQSEANTEAYSASKGGILAITHALAVSLGPKIMVNSISPGWIDVSSIKKSAKNQPDKITAADHAQHPAGRVGEAQDIVSMIEFLADEKNSFITGQNIVVDGGMTSKMIYI